MIVDITTAAVSRRIAHLEAVKRDLSITDTSADAAILDAIDTASDAAAYLMGFEPWMQSYRIRMAGDGGTYLRHPVFPLVSVSEVADITWADGVETFTAIDSDEYEIESTATAADRRDRIRRNNGWAKSAAINPTRRSSQERALLYRTTCVAGWATPIDRWVDSAVLRLGEYVRETDRSEALRHEVTTAGTCASSEPTWATTAGATTVSGSVTFTARAAIEMPRHLWKAGVYAAKFLYQHADLVGVQPPGVKSMAGGGMRIEWDGSGGETVLPRISAQTFEGYAA